MTKARTVVITGGGSGMGRAAALKFAELNDTVYILGRRQNKLDEVAAVSDKITSVQTDVTDLNSVKQAYETITAKSKVIDVLVNCAGGNVKLPKDPTTDDELEAWDQILKTNLTSVFIVTNIFADALSKPGGRVINITSLAAISGSRQPGATGQAYSAAKSGIHGMTRTLVSKFAQDGITINSIAPGVIESTDFFTDGKIPNELGQYYLAKTPLERFGTPEEIAAGIVYLASGEAGFITGEMLNINGGVQFGR